MASWSTCPTAVTAGSCAYWSNCGNAGGFTCPARSVNTSDAQVIIFHYHEEKQHLPKLALGKSLAEMKAILSREAGNYWAWVERKLPPLPSPPPPKPRRRNRCCSGSSRHMVHV